MKVIKENKGFVQFLLRSIIFFMVLFGFKFFVFLYFRHTLFFKKFLALPGDFYFDFLTGLRARDFLNSALFTLTIFAIWNRNRLLKLKPYKQNIKQSVIFAVLAVITQILHYLFKYSVRINMDALLKYNIVLTLVKYLFNILFIVFLGLAAYNFKFFKDNFNIYKKQIPILGIILVVYFFLIQFFQRIWRVLGNFVAFSVSKLLSLTLADVYLEINAASSPKLGANNFIVGISKECSGIDSLLLFLSLYTVILVLDWKRISKKRFFLLLIPGVLGTIFYNLFRVYLLLLVGVYYSPEFAVDMFHSNIGWILFLVFFIVFWHFGSDWVYKKTTK